MDNGLDRLFDRSCAADLSCDLYRYMASVYPPNILEGVVNGVRVRDGEIPEMNEEFNSSFMLPGTKTNGRAQYLW